MKNSLLFACALACASHAAPPVITNHGLVALGRIPAFPDAQGSTFGSVSALAALTNTWKFDAASAEYSCEFLTLPDRGHNDPDKGAFVDYQGRTQRLLVSFKAAAADQPLQPALWHTKYLGLTLLHEKDGTPLTGNDPGDSVGEFASVPLPRNRGHICLDAEGLAIDTKGFWISDEYSPAIFRFDLSGVLESVTHPPLALAPRSQDQLPHFTSTSPPATGRRNNQGFEGLSLSPSGTRLFVMNQSAPMQDAPTNHLDRRFTRLLVYTVGADHTSLSLSGHYIVELPTYSEKPPAPANRSTAVSEIVALNDDSLLVLARDNCGRGGSNGIPPRSKQILLTQIATATNLLSTPYNGPQPAVINGSLAPGLTPLRCTPVVDMLDPAQLKRAGLNTAIDADHKAGDSDTISEKWEGLALLPDIATPQTEDYFLFIANDNDFMTTNGVVRTFSDESLAIHDSLELDTMFLVYRITIKSPQVP